MNGAELIVEIAAREGIELCLANPGTTEMPLVTALAAATALRSVLVLHEGVAAGAADGYYRLAGKPAMTLLHLGPGLANAAAYLHDARRANSGVVNLVGEHATWHLPNDPPLAMDIASLAQTVSRHVGTISGADTVAPELCDAIGFARRGAIATVIVPHDAQLADATSRPESVAPPPAQAAKVSDIAAAASLLAESPSVLILGAEALSEAGLRAAGRIAATGIKVIAETFPARVERGGGLFAPERIPYFPEQAVAFLADARGAVLAGARAPVAFFGYPGVPGLLLPDECVLREISPQAATLEDLANKLGAPPPALRNFPEPKGATGPLDPPTFARAVAAAIPENAILMDEGNTSSGTLYPESIGAPRHSYLTQPGGAIGLGLPAALGAALACPNRPVLAVQADGSALYTLQALWSMAREGANVTVILCDNASYRILGVELARAGRGPAALYPVERELVGLTEPRVDWLALAAGFGVPSCRVSEGGALTEAIRRNVGSTGPHLIVADIV